MRHVLVSGVVAMLLASASVFGADASLPQDTNEVGESPDAILAKLREAERKAERKDDFNQSLDILFPLTVEEILKAKERSDHMEGAIQPKPAKMRTESRSLNVTPGAAPQVVRLTGGYSSTIVFQDITGAPWPVTSMILGSPSAFSATQPRAERNVLTEGGENAEAHPDAGNANSNIINIVPLTQRASSNLVVNLEDCPYPVIIHLLTESSMKGKRSADALVVFRLDKSGPKAHQPKIGPGIAEAVSPELLGFVHGVPPADAKLLAIEPGVPGVRAWKHRGRIYLRTSHSLVWPAWLGSAGGEDMRVYIIPPTQSAVISVDGSQQKIKISGGK